MTGLTCYSCNNDAPETPDCIDNPNKYSSVNCMKDDDRNLKEYCYTTRMETTDPESGEPSMHNDNLYIFAYGLDNLQIILDLTNLNTV